MSPPLLLNSLEIQQFRAFRHLRVERLGRVNLIVGKNNVGKSCFLEALWLFADRGSPSLLWELLKTRNEDIRSAKLNGKNIESQFFALKHLFYGRKIDRTPSQAIKIGPISPLADVFSITTGWYAERSDETKLSPQPMPLFLHQEPDKLDNPIPGLIVQIAEAKSLYKLKQGIPTLRVRFRPEPNSIPHIFVAPNGLDAKKIGELWDSIALTDPEKDVLAGLRIIAPEVERINLIGGPEGRGGARIPMVKLRGLDEPIPLRSLGEGMSRMFGITLALVNARDGILLIDEIDSGLHYSVQTDLWHLIFEAAHRLNVQVFATSHSWDCIEAFQQAAQENKQEEGLLISLRRQKDEAGDVTAILFDEKELGIATREQIEVR